MFEFIRKHSKMVMIVLFLLIIPSFVLVGSLDRYSLFDGQGDTVAVVDGQAIKRAEWDAAHQAETNRVRMANPQIDAALLDSPEARYYSLENLVRQRVLAAAAQKAGLVATDAKLAAVLRQNPELLNPDGTVNAERYKALVGAQNMTPALYEARLRSELSLRQVMQGVGGTAFVPNALADLMLESYFGRREIQVHRFGSADFVTRATPTEAEIEAFYKTHEARYRTPEQATVDYVVLDAEAVQRGVSVNEQELRTYYEQNVAAQAAQQQRRVSHIMIEVPASASSAERDKAKARAEELLTQVRKAPDTFADVARKDSQDPGSASNGGDLDFAARGGFVSKALEDAAFGLKAKGDISDVVQSEFGYHIVRLTDTRAPAVQSFEQSRARLEAEYRTQQAQRLFSEVAEQFTNTVYEQSDSLQPVAERLKLQVRTATIGRTPEAGAAGPLGNRNFVNALFSADSLERKRNTEAIEVGPSQLAAGRVTQYSPARTQPLAEVRDKVRTALVAERAAELARKEGEAKLAEWKADPAKAQLGAVTAVSRDQPGNVSPDIIEAALRVDTTALPGFVGLDLGSEGYAVVKVNKVLERPALPPEAMAQVRGQLSQANASAESLAYYEFLKTRFKVKIEPARPAPSTAIGG